MWFWRVWTSLQFCAFALLGLDKASAVLKLWRVSTAVLFCACFAGPVGALLGTFVWNHKRVDGSGEPGKSGALKKTLPKMVPVFCVLWGVVAQLARGVVGPMPFPWSLIVAYGAVLVAAVAIRRGAGLTSKRQR